MSDLKLFRTADGRVSEIGGHSVALEKSLQKLIEQNLETFFGVRLVASEHSTGKRHGGRIDTLGLDENNYPVIIEYKRTLNENVINQGLFYLDWLMDHQADFRWLVLDRYGKAVADSVEWGSPRLLCVAGDFTKYDVHAVQQINRNVELVRYRRFGDELLLLELVNAVTARSSPTESPAVVTAVAPLPGTADGAATPKKGGAAVQYKTVSQFLAQADTALSDRFARLREELLAMGDDVQEKTLKFYFAFKRLKNFACVEVRPQNAELLVYVKVDPDSIQLEEGFTRDVRSIGHFGTGDLEIRIRSNADLERALPLIHRSYEAS
jgi:predicted transport protein